MLSYFVDPRKQELTPWPDKNNRPVQDFENPVSRLKIACERVRELIRDMGIDITYVPVIHRTNNPGKVRYWNLQEGRIGSSVYCRALVDDEDASHTCGWRLATKEEVKAHEDNCERARKEYARRKLRYDAAAVKQVSSQHALQALVDAANVPEEDLEALSTEERNKLRTMLDDAESKAKKKVKA